MEQPQEIPVTFDLGGHENQESPESEKERAAFNDIIDIELLSDDTFIDILAHSDAKKSLESLPALADSYGFDLADVSSRDLMLLSTLYCELKRADNEKSIQEIQNAIEQELKESLARQALSLIENISSEIEQSLENEDKLKQLLRQVMDILGKLSKHIPQETDPELWQEMYDGYKRLIDIKLTDAKTSRVFSEIFQEYTDLIDNEFALKAMNYAVANKLGYDLESIMQLTYGRPKSELEEIKKQNRANVVEKLQELSNQNEITVDDIINLHRTNNLGVTPQALSRLREGEELEWFGKRVGTLPEDVAQEMEAWQTRVNEILQTAEKEDWSDIRFQISVAQLHNQILDIHPFLDRNGSTSLIFMELMMMRRGYKPSKNRETDYYKHVRTILKNNPVAIGIVAYEMGLISYVPGYFKGETAQNKQAKYKEKYGLV